MKRMIKNVFGSIWFFISTIFGFFTSLLLKGFLTPILFSGKSIDGRDLFFQLLLIILYSAVLTIPYYFLISIIAKLFPNQTLRFQQKADRWNYLLRSDRQKRIILSILILCIGFFSSFILNNVVSQINTKDWKYENPVIIPVKHPMGGDFRDGIYMPAAYLILSHAKSIGPDGTYPSIYPPLVNVLSLPYLFFNFETAYLIHIIVLILANILSMAFASLIAIKQIFPGSGLEDKYLQIISFFIFLTMSFYTLSSYPFAFSIERGNIDILALFFALLAMWILIRKPEKVWLQTFLLSIAVHIKIYPIVLFFVLFYKHRQKLILPGIVTNLVFLFILGPENAIKFSQMVLEYGGIGTTLSHGWIGNHSSYSFAQYLGVHYPKLFSNFNLFWGVFSAIPVILWSMAVLRIIKSGGRNSDIPLLLMITIPLMDIIPSISNDYKLVILSPAVVLLIALIFKQMIQKFSWSHVYQLAGLFVILILIGRPYTMDAAAPYALDGSASFFIDNKYLWSVALESLMVFSIFKNSDNNPAEITACNQTN